MQYLQIDRSDRSLGNNYNNTVIIRTIITRIMIMMTTIKTFIIYIVYNVIFLFSFDIRKCDIKIPEDRFLRSCVVIHCIVWNIFTTEWKNDRLYFSPSIPTLISIHHGAIFHHKIQWFHYQCYLHAHAGMIWPFNEISLRIGRPNK